MSEIQDNRIILSIDLKKYRLRIYRTALKQLGNPAFIQLLISPKDNAIIIMGCEEHIPGGQEIRVVFDKPSTAGTFDIYSKELISRLKKQFTGLDAKGLYRLNGTFRPDDGYVCFPLSTLSRAEEPHA